MNDDALEFQISRFSDSLFRGSIDAVSICFQGGGVFCDCVTYVAFGYGEALEVSD